jgi:hypothetical protein
VGDARFYSLSRKGIQRVFESLCGLENVQIEDRGIVLAALNAYQKGLDLADALHPGAYRFLQRLPELRPAFEKTREGSRLIACRRDAQSAEVQADPFYQG